MLFLRLGLAAAAICFLSGAAFATYDSDWFVSDGWSGEPPHGFAVVEAGVYVRARVMMDRRASPSVRCELPQNAVISPLHAEQRYSFKTATKIVEMKLKDHFTVTDLEDKPVTLRKGETLQYLRYLESAEYLVRARGQEFRASQELLDNSAYDEPALLTPPDEWVYVECVGGARAWILLSDVHLVDESGDESYLPGLDTWALGVHGEFGEVRDLESEPAPVLPKTQ